LHPHLHLNYQGIVFNLQNQRHDVKPLRKLPQNPMVE
jgi:hypothetical protein